MNEDLLAHMQHEINVDGARLKVGRLDDHVDPWMVGDSWTNGFVHPDASRWRDDGQKC